MSGMPGRQRVAVGAGVFAHVAAAEPQRAGQDVHVFEADGYGLALTDSHGWIGHDGVMFGWESTTIYLPSEKRP
jgi:hypothetical protein